MAESDIAIIPQGETVQERIVVVTETQRERGYNFDAVRRYRTRRTYRPTKHSLPNGSPITDHVATDPISFQMVGLLTPHNQIINASAFPSVTTEEDAQALVEFFSDPADGALELVRRNRDALIQYADEKTLLTLIGDDLNLPNMVITSIDDPKTPELGDAYELTIGFRQVRVPRSASRIAPIVSDDVERLGGGDFSLGSPTFGFSSVGTPVGL